MRRITVPLAALATFVLVALAGCQPSTSPTPKTSAAAVQGAA